MNVNVALLREKLPQAAAELKDVRTAIDGKKAKEAGALLKTAVAAIDSAASKGVIKRGTASRSVSRLTVAVSALKA